MAPVAPRTTRTIPTSMRTRAGLVALLAPIILGVPRTAGAQGDATTPPRILSVDRADLHLMPLPVAAEIRPGSLDLRRGLTTANMTRLTCLSLFWHFLDIVWIGVFTIVYLMGVA